MFRRLILILIVILLLILGAEAALPRILEEVVAQGMSSLTGSREVEAKLEKSPAIFMLAGQFDRVTLNAADAKIDKISVRTMHVSMDDVELDGGKLFSEQKIIIKKTDDIKLTATITQEELANYLNTSVKGIRDATVDIVPEKVTVGSQLTVGGLAKIDVKLEGKIIGDKQKIKFTPDRFSINSSSVNTTSIFGGTLLSEIVLLDSSKLPFGVVVRDIVMQNGQVVIHADNMLR